MESAFGVEHTISKMVIKAPPKGKKKLKVELINRTTKVGTLTPVTVALKSITPLKAMT